MRWCRSTELFWKGLGLAMFFVTKNSTDVSCIEISGMIVHSSLDHMYLPKCSLDVSRLTSYLEIIHPGGLATMQPCFLTGRCEIPYTWKILQQRTPFGSHPVTHSDIEQFGSSLRLLQARNHYCTPSTTKHTVLHHALVSRVADIDVGGGDEDTLQLWLHSFLLVDPPRE